MNALTTVAEPGVVLIVDDTPDNLAMLSDALNDAGYMVLVALDGLSALNRIERRRPDLILLDAMMPGLDGFETCRRIKEHPANADIPVLFMTALTESRHVVQGFEVGGSDYVTKPIQTDEVLARVAAHLAHPAVGPSGVTTSRAEPGRRAGAQGAVGTLSAHWSGSRGSALGGLRQDQPRHWHHSRSEPTHREQTSGTCVCEVRCRNAHSSDLRGVVGHDRFSQQCFKVSRDKQMYCWMSTRAVSSMTEPGG